MIMSSEQELECEEREGFSDLVNQSRKFIAILNTTQQAHIAKLKGLFEGFRRFCSEESLDSENVLKTIPIAGCCYDLDVLLMSDIQIDSQYVNQVKNFFFEHWHL
ncbi:MAG: hypothetical protein QM652_11760 [Legionella sp.]|uniref:hypothetical protein n=1 Tax=Legionella sp. TaxID=459 RepID=UPI0039E387ED